MSHFSQEAHEDGSTILRISGEIDLAVAEELGVVAQACLQESTGIKLDLGEVTFIDSSGLGVLVRVHKDAVAKGKTFRLVSVSNSVERLLEVTGLDRVFYQSGTS